MAAENINALYGILVQYLATAGEIAFFLALATRVLTMVIKAGSGKENFF